MLNKEIISASVPTLNPNNSVSQALELMSEFHVSQLPVVNDEKYVGLIFEEDLLNANEEDKIQTLENRYSRIAVHANTHFIESIQAAHGFCSGLHCYTWLHHYS